MAGFFPLKVLVPLCFVIVVGVHAILGTREYSLYYDRHSLD